MFGLQIKNLEQYSIDKKSVPIGALFYYITMIKSIIYPSIDYLKIYFKQTISVTSTS